MTDASERLLEVSGCSVEHRGSLSGVPRSCSGSSLGMGFLGQPAGCQWLLPSPKFLFLRTEARGIALKAFESFSALYSGSSVGRGYLCFKSTSPDAPQVFLVIITWEYYKS